MKTIPDSENLICFGKFIRDRREQLSLSQEEVAYRLGVSQTYYSFMERGKRNVDFVVAIKICNILSLDLKDYIKQYLE